MRTLVLLICLLLSFTTANAAIPKEHQDQFFRIAKLVRENRVRELAALVAYPLKRENPLPNIQSTRQFISYYGVLFDSAFKARVGAMHASDMFESRGVYGLFNGAMWIDEDGRIIAINHSSPEELRLKDSLTRVVKSKTHASVQSWNSNVLVYNCCRHTLRIDETDDGLRLSTWRKGRSMKAKPELVVQNGVEEFYGTQGGVGYTFTVGEWTYVIERIDMCEELADCGSFMAVSRNGRVKSRCKCTERK